MNFCELETHCFDDDAVHVVDLDGGIAVVGDHLEIGSLHHFEAAGVVTCGDGAEWPHMVEACQVDLGLHY